MGSVLNREILCRTMSRKAESGVSGGLVSSSSTVIKVATRNIDAPILLAVSTVLSLFRNRFVTSSLKYFMFAACTSISTGFPAGRRSDSQS